MQWNLENLNVTAVYLDSIPVAGMVTLSRVRYGGEVSHHITLTSPITVYGTVRDSVIVDHKHIQTISSS
jgi:hypothetical protein